ncbi:MAG: site-specific integrase, partial [Rhodococcus sp. (in: high G+C Gram-positive bacteria)]
MSSKPANPDAYAALLARFADHLSLQRNRSDHTVRAYVADSAALLEYCDPDIGDGDRECAALESVVTLTALRSWLASMAAAGSSRSTLARRASSARTFTAWLCSVDTLSADPAARLAAPPARRTLPGV